MTANLMRASVVDPTKVVRIADPGTQGAREGSRVPF